MSAAVAPTPSSGGWDQKSGAAGGAGRDIAGRLGRPLRIARVITRLNVGGPARHVILLSAGLDACAFATTLITGSVGRGEGDLIAEARARHVEPLVIPELRRDIAPHFDCLALARLVRLFRALRPDIVHTHTAKAGALGRVAARLARVPMVVHTFHGHVLNGYFSPAVTRLFLAVERALARRTDRLITVSPGLRAALLDMGIGRPERTEVVPLGLDLDPFATARVDRAGLRRNLGLASDASVLAIVGRLTAIKDHPTLFAALQQLDAAVHLAVIGDGEDRAALERLVGELDLRSRVHFLGWRHDLPAMMGGMDVVICCSRNEGTPVALIEAMAAGVPVVATAVGGVPDLVVQGKTGWLCAPGDPVALADAIRATLSNPSEAARIAAEGRRAVLERHGAATLVRRMEEFYGRLIAETKETGCESW